MKKNIGLNSTFYKGSEFENRAKNSLSKKALIESIRGLSGMKNRSQSNLNLHQARRESNGLLPHHSSAPNLQSESIVRKSFVASTLFKQRLTNKNVLPKKNIAYIAHPIKVLVMKND